MSFITLLKIPDNHHKAVAKAMEYIASMEPGFSIPDNDASYRLTLKEVMLQWSRDFQSRITQQ